MGEPRIPEVAGALGRPLRLLIAASLAALGAVAWLQWAPSPVTRWAATTTAFFPSVLLILRLARHWEHPDRVLRAACWIAVGAGLFALALPRTVGGIAGVLAMLGLVWAAWGGVSWAFARALARAPARATTLSVAVICKDEADRIGRMLEAVHGWADEIVVLDSGSRDGTVELARRYSDKVEVTDWPGFGVQKQRALERCTGEWVLSLDADEVPSEALKREIDSWLARPPAVAGFRLLRGSVLFGGPVMFGADGDHHIRLFRRQDTRFDLKPVHEDVVVDGRIGTLESPFWHFTFRDFAHLRTKFGEYALLQARKRHEDGKRATLAGAWLRGLANFLLMYLWRLGLLDGRRGLLMAAVYSHYTFDKYAALWSFSQGPRRR